MARHAYRTISADSHTLEPPDLWEKWLESKYLDTAPKLVEDKDGGHAWVYMGGNTPEPLGLVSCAGIRPEDLKWTGARYGETTNPAAREIHPGCYLGDKRLELMDIDGVDAEILYPPQRAMLTFMKNPDAAPHLAGIRAYNRWLRDGFCAPDPDRLIGIFQIPNVGIDTSARRRRGTRASRCRHGPRAATICEPTTIPSGTPPRSSISRCRSI
jgi:hypothetical protein